MSHEIELHAGMQQPSAVASSALLSPPPGTIIIAISGRGKMNVDDIKVGQIVLDQQAKNLIQRRANEESISLADAFEKTLIEAIHERMDEHEPRNWWA